MFLYVGAILKATNSSFQKGMTFFRSVYVKKVIKLLAFIFEQPSYEIIRIHHEYEGKIEKSVPRIAVWHHKACEVMTNCDPEGRIFLSYPHTSNGFLFLLTTVFILK